MQAAQILAGATMVLFLACGVVPWLRPYANRIRIAVLAAYLLCGVMLVVYEIGLR